MKICEEFVSLKDKIIADNETFPPEIWIPFLEKFVDELTIS